MQRPDRTTEIIELNILMRSCTLEILPLLNDLFRQLTGRNHERYDRFFN